MTTTEILDRPSRSDAPRPATSRPRGVLTALATGFAAAVAVAAWLPFVDGPLSSDESGFLLLAQHWRPGTSLYGPYWVDRPPLLLWLFSLAGLVGPAGHSAAGLTAPAVKVLGAAASGLSAVLVALVAHLVAPGQGWTRRAALVAAVALLSSPLLGMPETDGEVLAVPFVLLGVACLVASTRRTWDRDAVLLTLAAGAAAMGAALVKQNVVDVFVLAAALLATGRHRLSRPGSRASTFAAGSLAVLVVVMATAAARGTSSSGLWDAVVVFRLQAAQVIGDSVSSGTQERLAQVVLSGVASGGAVLLLLSAVGVLQTRRRDVRRPAGGAVDSTLPGRALVVGALAMALWEACAVALGGSYWLHYLTGLVPGVILLVTLVRPSDRWRRVLTVCLAYVVVASAVVWLHHATTPVPHSDDAHVAGYLRRHAHHSDGVVVAFGHPDIVAASGLASPYEYLWSLPVRVRDPHLRELGHVMSAPEAPRWVVVAGDSLGSWGLDADATQQLLVRHYVERVTYGEWHVWRRRTRGSPG